MQSVRTHPTVFFRSGPVRSFLGLAAVSLLAAAFVACASSQGSARGGAGGDVSFTDVARNTKLRLVSDKWVASQGYEGATVDERRANFYGKNVYTLGSGAPAVKVCDDSIFDGVVQALDEAGFPRYALAGAATASASGASQFIELSVDGELRHFARTKGMPIEAGNAFRDCLFVIGEVFNAVEGYQSGDGGFQFGSKPPRSGS